MGEGKAGGEGFDCANLVEGFDVVLAFLNCNQSGLLVAFEDIPFGFDPLDTLACCNLARAEEVVVVAGGADTDNLVSFVYPGNYIDYKVDVLVD